MRETRALLDRPRGRRRPRSAGGEGASMKDDHDDEDEDAGTRELFDRPRGRRRPRSAGGEGTSTKDDHDDEDEAGPLLPLSLRARSRTRGPVMSKMAQAGFAGAEAPQRVKAENSDRKARAQARADPIDPPVLPEPSNQLRSK